MNKVDGVCKIDSFFISNRQKCWAILWALILAFAFFIPYFFEPNVEAVLTDDLYNIGFPQFVEGYHMAKNGAFVGIDMLTNNGASAYFLRPNISVYYPLYQIAYKTLFFDSIHQQMVSFLVVTALQAVISIYFCICLGIRFFKLNLGLSCIFLRFIRLQLLHLQGFRHFTLLQHCFHGLCT